MVSILNIEQHGIHFNHDFYVVVGKQCRTLVNLYKDIVLATRLHIFCTTLFTNNNIKVVIQMRMPFCSIYSYWPGSFYLLVN